METMKNPITSQRARIVFPSPDACYKETYLDSFIHLLQPKTANVPDELAGEVPLWRPWMPVLIQAGTGTGKSTFVLNVICRLAERKGKTVLIVSNRLALNVQYKIQLIRMLQSELEEEMTPIGIQRMSTIGCVTVVAYQGLWNFMKKYRDFASLGEQGFDYVVFDEAHFFTSDALFANDTGALLNKIPQVFHGSIRVYMTATPWGVQNLIAKAEEAVPPPMLKRVQNTFGDMFHPSIYERRCMLCSMGLPWNLDTRVLDEEPHELRLYRFPDKSKDYRLHWLPAKVRDGQDQELVRLIKGIPEGEKAVIFVNSKKYGKQLTRELQDAAYLDADSKSGQVWEQITSTSRFQASVLVTTAVADCGVNIIDPAVRHIVLFTTDHVQFMQELGRIRLKDSESLNVYIPGLSNAQLSRLNGENEKWYQELKNFEHMTEEERFGQIFRAWESENSVMRHLFSINGMGRLHVNCCAKTLVIQRRLAFQELRELEQAGEKEPFLRKVCQWLGQPDLSIEDHWCHNDAEACRRQMFEFLKHQVGCAMTAEEERERFATELKKLRYLAYGPRKEDNGSRTWGAAIIQKELERLNLPFRLEASKSKWMLTAVDLPENDSQASKK